MTDDAELVLDAVSRAYDAGGAGVRALSLRVAKGEVLALIGPSGCGKSTTLRLIAGLDEPDAGDITLGGRSMRRVPPQDRDVAMVFQGYALYPHMTAREIMAFPLRMRGVARAERDRAVDDAAAMLGVKHLLARRPDQLSGGERQRIAMGRAIVRRPRLFLFDEPLSNIDPSLRDEIRREIAALLRRLDATALYVTHDHVEAMSLADRVAVLRAGVLQQCAAPQALYERPANAFVARFLGGNGMNLLDATRDGERLRIGPLTLAAPHACPSRVLVGIRPEHVRLEPGGAAFRVRDAEPHGPHTIVQLVADDLELRAQLPGFVRFDPDATVNVRIDTADVHLFDPEADGARVEGA